MKYKYVLRYEARISPVHAKYRKNHAHYNNYFIAWIEKTFSNFFFKNTFFTNSHRFWIEKTSYKKVATLNLISKPAEVNIIKGIGRNSPAPLNKPNQSPAPPAKKY